MSFYPSREDVERVERVKETVKREVEKCLKDIDYGLVFAGSTALGTYVKGEYDVDVFIVSRQKDEAFSRVSKCIVGAVKKGELDIWHTSIEGVDVDIVFLDPEHPKTQTLKHTEHYSKILNDELRREIIKAKALMKGRGCYGAELGGITGIALTELVSKHGSLDEACRTLLKDKGIHLSDPTNPKRNLLASVTPVRWRCIEDACREYLETGVIPSEKYTEETFKREMEGKGFKTMQLERKDDRAVDYARAMSACVRCGNELKNIEKDVEYECNAYVESGTTVAYKITPEELTPTRKVKIPLTLPEEAIEEFRKHHPDAKEVNGYLEAEVPRKIVKPREWMEKCVTSRF
ncbi:MAG: nucleotidyltransferase domain-containing protein [Candidatus Bathyarchaeia archaeon]